MEDIITGTILAVLAFLIIVKGGQTVSGGATAIQTIAGAISKIYVGAVTALQGR